jgi:hypothetical protein
MVSLGYSGKYFLGDEFMVLTISMSMAFGLFMMTANVLK